MRFSKVLTAAATFTLMGAVSALADMPKVYAVHSQHNYCPAGLQPVTISGVICCGRPNQTMSYQQVMAHPVAKKKHVRHVRRASSCRVGEKGCTYD
mmetsp:Transcript_5247/g.9640  ORF Transcript_5247/g.9640 Transcript_5247/m.9640 type:complete len:96 (+) Transcript_5247:62-349(+)